METKLCLFLSIASAFYSQETTILSAKSKPAFFFSSRFKKVQKLRGVKPAQKSSSSEPFFEPSNLTTGDKVWTFQVFSGKICFASQRTFEKAVEYIRFLRTTIHEQESSMLVLWVTYIISTTKEQGTVNTCRQGREILAPSYNPAKPDIILTVDKIAVCQCPE